MTRSLSLPISILATLTLLLGCGAVGLKTNAQTTNAGELAGRELAPEFALADTDGSIVSLDDLLAGGRPAVLVFYRGHW